MESPGTKVTLRLLCLAGALALWACPTVAPIQECDPDTNEPCFDDAAGISYVCDPVSLQCLRACERDADCLQSQECDLTDPTRGMCRIGAPQPGDPGPGDPGPGDPGPGDPGPGDPGAGDNLAGD